MKRLTLWFFYRICLFFVACLLVWEGTQLLAGERPKPYDLSSKLDSLGQFLRENSPRYRLIEGDLFEKQRAYQAYAPSNMLAQLRYVPSTSQDKPEAFIKEIELLSKHLKQSQKDITADQKQGSRFTKSLSVQTAFQFPGKENFVFYAKPPIHFTDALIQASLWIHSQKYPHCLVLLFQNSRGRKVRVSTGPLLWQGWRRISIDLPHSLATFPRVKATDKQKHSFLGFMIQSLSWARAGRVALQIDNFLFLSHIREPVYPGSEIEDTWGRK